MLRTGVAGYDFVHHTYLVTSQGNRFGGNMEASGGLATSRSVKKGIITFLVITFSISAPGWVLAISTDQVPLILVFAPTIAALITKFVYQRNLRDLGWGWGGWKGTRYALLAYALPLGIGVVIYGGTWLAVRGAFSSDDGVGAILVTFLLAATGGMLLNCIFAFGEELGWRGFLVPQLAKVTSFPITVLISGLIWALWHYPLIFFAAELFEYSDAPAWFALPSFTLVIVVVSVIIAWLRLKTRSLWPAVILHASNNNFNSGFLGDLTSSSGTAPYIVTEVGVGLLLAWGIVAYLFWRRRTELPMASAPLIAL